MSDKTKYLDFYNSNFGNGKYCTKSWGMASYQAGAQSRQAEIDGLQIKYDAMYQAFTVADECRKEWHRCYIGVRNREDELQKQIDEAIEVFEAHDLSHIDQIEKVYGILKGNQNEN